MYLSLRRNIREIVVWWWYAEKGPAEGCRWDAPAVAFYPRPILGPQVMRIPAVSLLNNVCPLLDEGFMCKAWWFRSWVEFVARMLFHPTPQWPTCHTWGTAVHWNVLTFMTCTAWKSRSCEQSKDYSKYIVFFWSNFLLAANLASPFGLATIFITMSFLLIFFPLQWLSSLIFIF